ncbi:uncharacterized protein EDB91DRAFT_1253976 [Suillus paluster]|uniref:uncharacterized protein n=1 Tax=Suillus paluster TaxID=48578 RepID=UPI001B86CEF4|nr:uncharacterized protein EDB91DRAFT_1253976 [Suillus paluster]KAG1727285.1 hypothetical protein EDB91DRAFT_1253976 [Suillus paluster]
MAQWLKKSAGPPIGETEWTTALIWLLLAQAEKTENRKTLLRGKRDKNTLKDMKIVIFKRIGSVILADLHAINPDAVGNHIKKQFNYLVNHYKHHAHQLRATGEGLQDDNSGDERDEEHFNHYVPLSGLDDSTPMHIKSIWEFSVMQLQQFWALQEALDATQSATPLTYPNSFPDSLSDSFPSGFKLDSDKENHLPLPTPTPNQVPSKSQPASPPPSTCTSKSLLSHDAIEKTKQCISKLPKKRTFEDVLENLQQQLLLEEFKAGIWEIEEYWRKLKEPDKDKAGVVEIPSRKRV